jgi:hypothetical protein
MRVSPALVLAAMFVCSGAAAQSAIAQQQDTPGQGSGIGPGQGPPPGSRIGAVPTPGHVCDPSFGGKYSQLIRQLTIPEDEGQYGKCHDYGAWSGSEYKGHANLPPNAFWSYSAPNWYLWARHGAGAAAGGCPDPTFGGKYSGVLRRLEVAQDRSRYGACNDYGAWSGNAYAGHANLPNGYWVYSYPHWIIYGNRGGQPKH